MCKRPTAMKDKNRTNMFSTTQRNPVKTTPLGWWAAMSSLSLQCDQWTSPFQVHWCDYHHIYNQSLMVHLGCWLSAEKESISLSQSEELTPDKRQPVIIATVNLWCRFKRKLSSVTMIAQKNLLQDVAKGSKSGWFTVVLHQLSQFW